MDTNQDYLWSLVDDELTIEMQHPEFYTPDLLSQFLGEIILALSLPAADKIRHIILEFKVVSPSPGKADIETQSAIPHLDESETG